MEKGQKGRRVMSRYTNYYIVGDHSNNLWAHTEIQYSYGYDRQIPEYFLNINEIRITTAPPPDGYELQTVILDDCIPLVGTGGKVYGSGANLIDMCEKIGFPLPDKHKEQAAMDLPIEGDGFTTIATLKGDEK